MITRARIVYHLLIAFWAIVVMWQGFEHLRVRDAYKETVIRRARDITSTLGLVVHSQRRFGLIASKPRLESTLKELVKSEELRGVYLLNTSGEVLVSAGDPPEIEMAGISQSGVHWGSHTVTVVNLVDLGANLQPDGATNPPTIVLPEPNPPPNRGREGWQRRGEPPPGSGTNSFTNSTNSASSTNRIDRQEARGRRQDFDRPRDDRPPGNRMPNSFGRPPWMNPEEFQTLIAQKGVHGLALVISTSELQAVSNRDLWIRLIVAGFAAVAAVGVGFGWRTLVKSSEYEMRLMRASQLNTHLREMNLAAAGLAHETRNPLNIIRGLAQMISKVPLASDEIRGKSLEITNEVDQVTAQLNEFIDYSKPREVRRSPVSVSTIAGDVVRALKSDLEDKTIKLELPAENLTVNADQQLLRQVLFNLLINAIQAVDVNGCIQIVTRKENHLEASLEVLDDGVGVPAENRQDIFRPYFTTREDGTGLGLAIVRQIALAHGWEVQCLPNNPKGARFRITRMELASTART